MTSKSIADLNKNLGTLSSDFLYHLGFDTTTHDLEKMFGDVKFVCMGGSSHRMEEFANYIKDIIGYELPVGTQLQDLCKNAHRYAFFKIGPVISVSHGMGMASMSILLHEMIKLVHYAKCRDPIFIRIGTSGGIGVEPGTVVVTKDAFNALGNNEHEFHILGKRVRRPASFSLEVGQGLVECSEKDDDFKTVLGNTMATDDFYEAQGRIDGAVCEHTEQDKLEFLKDLYRKGIRNIEMEACLFAALTTHTNIKACDVCVTLIDRLKGDQMLAKKEGKTQLDKRPQLIVGRYIKKILEK